jgi:hypothetical protein
MQMIHATNTKNDNGGWALNSIVIILFRFRLKKRIFEKILNKVDTPKKFPPK